MQSPAAYLARRLSREAEDVCRYYLSNGKKHGRYWLVGNARNDPGRSLYVRLTGSSSGPGAAGKWTDAATREHGDLLDLIALNLNLGALKDTLEEARRFLNLPRPEPPPAVPRDAAPSGSPEAARRLWAMGQPIAGTLAERYLAQRGIIGVRNMTALRYHPRCYYLRDDRQDTNDPETSPALLAKVTDATGALTGLHRTWLDPTTADKATLDPNRKATGHLLGNGVRIGASSDVLAVGEGVETMLSLRMTFPKLPVAAALSGNHLAAFIPPDSLQRLYIAVNADEAGRLAADALADRTRAMGIATIPLNPERDDFNDDLRAFGPAKMQSALRPQLSPIDAMNLIEGAAD